MESNKAGVITVEGLTAEELAKDFLTAAKAGGMDMQLAVQVLIERVFVSTVHQVTGAMHKWPKQKAILDQVQESQRRRAEARKARVN